MNVLRTLESNRRILPYIGCQIRDSDEIDNVKAAIKRQ